MENTLTECAADGHTITHGACDDCSPITSLAVKRGRKQIHSTPNGGISVDGPDGVNLYRLIVLKSGLNLETRTDFRMKLTRGPSCFTRISREFGFKGNKRAVFEAFHAAHGFVMDPEVHAKLVTLFPTKAEKKAGSR